MRTINTILALMLLAGAAWASGDEGDNCKVVAKLYNREGGIAQVQVVSVKGDPCPEAGDIYELPIVNYNEVPDQFEAVLTQTTAMGPDGRVVRSWVWDEKKGGHWISDRRPRP